MRCSCKYLSVLEAVGSSKARKYEGSIRPLAYEFTLNRGAEYLVFGLVVRHGCVWLYVVVDETDSELLLAPSVLFSFDDSVVPNGMFAHIDKEMAAVLELLPLAVAKHKGWFERYVEQDEEIRAIVQQEISRLSAEYPAA